MIQNPEFRRNLWLELSVYRVIGMPLVLGALFVLIYVLSTDNPYQAIVPYALTLYSLIIFLWGTRQSAESVIAEVRDRTWDQQRMSSIGPWSMTWAKLLGSTIFPWYGGLLCLLVYTVLTVGIPGERTLNTVGLFVVCGLFSNAVALLISMHAMKKDRTYNRSQAAAYLILGAMIVGPILSTAFKAYGSYTWLGQSFESRNFILTTAALFLGWTVIGIYRLMRTELQMKNGPFVWLAFACFMALFFSGFMNVVDTRDRTFDRFFTAFLVTAVLTYLMALSEQKDPVAFRRLFASLGRKEWRRVLQELPCWLVTLLPLLAAAIGMFFTSDSFFDPTKPVAGVRLVIVGACFLILRDLGLMLFFNLAKNQKRADMVLVLCLCILYGVVPLILNAINLDAMTALFWPRWDQYASLGTAAAGAEAALVLALVAFRWKKQYQT